MERGRAHEPGQPPAAHLVTRGGRRIELTGREFRILEYLARNAGRVVTRSMLLEHVWDYSFDPQTNIIDQHVSRLRHKLDRDGGESLIETVRGAGYSIRRSAAPRMRYSTLSNVDPQRPGRILTSEPAGADAVQ